MAAKIGRPVERQIMIADDAYSAPSRGQFAENYPAIQRFLEEKRKSPNIHKTGSMTVFVENTGYKLCLNDRPRERSTFVFGQRLGVAFETANRGLENGSLDWRSRGYKRPKA